MQHVRVNRNVSTVPKRLVARSRSPSSFSCVSTPHPPPYPPPATPLLCKRFKHAHFEVAGWLNSPTTKAAARTPRCFDSKHPRTVFRRDCVFELQRLPASRLLLARLNRTYTTLHSTCMKRKGKGSGWRDDEHLVRYEALRYRGGNESA